MSYWQLIAFLTRQATGQLSSYPHFMLWLKVFTSEFVLYQQAKW